jgi:acetyltransferase-like isoleucine patch superfamily enzyme
LIALRLDLRIGLVQRLELLLPFCDLPAESCNFSLRKHKAVHGLITLGLYCRQHIVCFLKFCTHTCVPDYKFFGFFPNGYLMFRTIPNKVDIPPEVRVDLKIEGTGNSVTVGRPNSAGNVCIHACGGARVSIGTGCVLGHLFVYAGPGSVVEIGAGVGFNGAVRLLLHEPKRISIGDHCLFAGGIDVTVSDMHPIFDLATKARINPPADICIGERVWIGQSTLILKGARIGNGCVIGAMSLVTGRREIPANSIAAGNPARVIRSGITWQREFSVR